MEWNELSRILAFLKRQQSVGYQGINLCITVMESDGMTLKEKKEALFELLERMGLFDKYISKKISKELEDKIRLDAILSGASDTLRIGPTYVTQLFDCEFLNGIIWFERGLN